MTVLHNLLMIIMDVIGSLVHFTVAAFVCSPRFKRLNVIEISHFLSLSHSGYNFVKSEGRH